MLGGVGETVLATGLTSTILECLKNALAINPVPAQNPFKRRSKSIQNCSETTREGKGACWRLGSLRDWFFPVFC